MRIYVRMEPLSRPVAFDVEPSLSVAELRERLGVEALFPSPALARRGGDGHGGKQGSSSCLLGAQRNGATAVAQRVPLDDAAPISALVQPHATITVGRRHPLAAATAADWRRSPTEVSTKSRLSVEGSGLVQWQLSKHPTPLVTSSVHGSFPPTATAPCISSEGAATAVEEDEATPLQSVRSDSPLPSLELHLPTQLPSDLLGEDWDDLSLIEDCDDTATNRSERGWSLASEIVHEVLRNEALSCSDEEELKLPFRIACRHTNSGEVINRRCSDEAELQNLLCLVLSKPTGLNASYPGLWTARLDAAGLCKAFTLLCSRVEGAAQQLVEAAAEGLQALAAGPMEDLLQRDQLRALAVYLCLPVHRTTQPGRHSRSILSSIAHMVTRMPAAGRAAFRDLVADECGDVRVLRDFLVPHVRSLADDAIRHVGQQPWLSGPLWEVVSQLQLQRSLWEAVLLLQVLASASEHAALLLRPGVTGGAASSSGAGQAVSPEGAAGPVSHEDSTGSSNASGLWCAAGGGGSLWSSQPGFTSRSNVSLLDLSAFHLQSLADGSIPPEMEFWLFQEHAQFHQITPAEVVDEPSWSDAAGMLPHRFCSFMAHSNLVPIAFKQRVLQVENILRQRLSQEQVLWPQAHVVLGGGQADPAAFYFMLGVNRQSLLSDTFAQMYNASPVDLRRPLRVEFTGEEAIDEGGVMREFFRLISSELFAPTAGLFFEAEDSRRLWFSPVLGEGRQLEDYWMVGVIVALAVYNNHPGMDVPLPSALFRKLKEQPTTHEDLVQLFPAQARSLEAILSWTPTGAVDCEAAALEADREFQEVFCLSYCFSTGNAADEVPLCEGGIDRPVRYRDREDFAGRVHEYLLHSSVQPQFESFSRGFRRVCNSPLFEVLSPEELEAIVAGEKDLDFSRLRQAVQYEGYSPTDPYVESLWAVLEGFSMPRRRRFLAFCTGSDVAPAGGLQDLHLQVQRHGEEPTMRLPVAHTCFNLLLLPRYSSPEKLRMMLVTAMEWTEGFGLQ